MCLPINERDTLKTLSLMNESGKKYCLPASESLHTCYMYFSFSFPFGFKLNALITGKGFLHSNSSNKTMCRVNFGTSVQFRILYFQENIRIFRFCDCCIFRNFILLISFANSSQYPFKRYSIALDLTARQLSPLEPRVPSTKESNFILCQPFFGR